MAALSKRRQVEALGWRFAAVPYFWAEGALWHDPTTGEKSAARYDYERPEAWIATPPAGSPVAERRFESRSVNAAVRWAFDQEKAPRLDADLTGVAALVALMGDARASGVVADVQDDMDCRRRPDAELLSLCNDALGAERIADRFRSEAPDPWTERPAFSAAIKRVSEAVRTQERLTPQIVGLSATTKAGIIAKAEVVGTLFHNSRGVRSAAVRSLVDDLLAVLGSEWPQASSPPSVSDEA